MLEYIEKDNERQQLQKQQHRSLQQKASLGANSKPPPLGGRMIHN